MIAIFQKLLRKLWKKPPAVPVEFKQVSVKARAAFGIMCLENALKHYQQDSKDWSRLLDQLWAFTSCTMLTNWIDATVELIPWSIVGEQYSLEDCETISENEFNELVSLYQKSTPIINEIVNHVFFIGSTDIYDSSLDESLTIVNDIIKLMRKNSIEMPEFDRFLKFSVDENHGWGRSFVKDEV